MKKTVSFFAACEARSEKTLVSQRITTPYVVRRIRASFAMGCENLHQLEFFIGDDSDAPSAGRPGGSNLLQDYGQVRYVAGDGEVVLMEHEVPVLQGNTWLKVYANNTDYYAHDINVQITIETQERRE